MSARLGYNGLIIVRAPYLYGPGNSSDRELFFWRHAVNGLPIYIPDRDTFANFIFVDDFAKAIIAIGETDTDFDNGLINISSGQAISLRQFTDACVAVCGANTSLIKEVDNTYYGIEPRRFFPFRTDNLVLSNDLFQKHFPSNEFQTDLRIGLKPVSYTHLTLPTIYSV